MFKITLIISILFLMLALICFACANVNYKKALEYLEQKQDENSIKRGVLFLLFSRYSDLFLKLSGIGFALSFIIGIF